MRNAFSEFKNSVKYKNRYAIVVNKLISETTRSPAPAVVFINYQNKMMMMMMKVLESKGDEVAGYWKRLRNKEIHV